MGKRYHRYRDDGGGNVYEKHGAFHVRWWYVDGDGRRRQRSKRLCDKDREHASTRSKLVLELAAQALAEGRGNLKEEPESPTSIIDFFDQIYLPWATTQLKPSSLHSLKQIWSQHLAAHFHTTNVHDYKTHAASRFLTALVQKYSRNTIQHIRSTMSGVFTHAVNLGLIESNPIHECKVLAKMRPPMQTPHYSLEELEDIVTALVDEPELQLVVCLAGFAGLRPGEIAALRWEDFDEDWVHVRRGISRKSVQTPKTDSSVRSAPLIRPTKLALAAWRTKCRSPKDGWVFPGRFKDRPGGITTRTRLIKAIITGKGIPWRTLYAGRRGVATILTQLTGNPLAAAQLLGHKDYSITMAAYIKQDRKALIEGAKVLETKLTGS